MKKYVKLMVFGLLVFLSSLTVNAKKMSIDELGEEALKLKPSTQYVYVIGSYAFTSEYRLTTSDVMLAAKSIDEPDVLPDGTPNLAAMNIQKIVPVLNDFELTGKWKVAENLVGNKKLDPDKELNIYFIDGKHYGETSSANVISNFENIDEYNSALNDLSFKGGNSTHSEDFKIENNKVTGLLLKTDISDNVFSGDDKTGYYFAYVLEVPDATSKTKVTIKGYKNQKEVGIADFDIKPNKEGKNPGVLVLASVSPETPVNERKFVITIDIDGTNLEYNPIEYTLDYSELRFQQESSADLTSENIPEVDITKIATNYGYQKSSNDTYKLVKENNIYKLKGDIVDQTIADDVFPLDEETNYYFMINVGQNLDSKYYNKATVTYPGDGSTKTSTIIDNTGLTILFSTSEAKKNNKITITVDLDGNKNEYYKVDYEIDLSELEFRKTSEFTLKELTDASKFAKQNGWYATDKGYSIEVKKDDLNKTLYHVSGLLPIVDDTTWDIASNLDSYYMGLLLDLVNKDINNASQNKISIKIDGDKFIKEFSLEGSSKEIYILKAIQETDSKELKIIVDLDGDDKTYLPYEITLDCSNLKFQSLTNATVNVPGNKNSSGIVQEELDQLDKWGYKFPNDITLSNDNPYSKNLLTYDSKTSKLTGAIKEQKLIGGFKESDLDAYFYAFTIKPEVVTDKIKVTIKKGEDQKEFTYQDFVQDTLTVLQHIPLDDVEDKKIEITVDSDGDSNNYTKNKYTIDYSDATFVPLHTVTIKDGLNGKVILTKDIYDQEKIEKPETPITNVTAFTKLAYWYDQTNDTEFKFENGVTSDVTIYPLWNLFIDNYIKASLDDINKNNIEFNIESISKDELKVDLEERGTKLSEITDTKLADRIANALARGMIKNIKLELDGKSIELSTTKTNKDEVLTDVVNELKAFFTEVVEDTEKDKTLDDLYKVWKGKELILTVTPKEKVAKFSDSELGVARTFRISIEEEKIISFDAGVFENPENKYVPKGGNIEELPKIEIPEEESYRTFDGWFIDSIKQESLTNIQDDTKLTAHYTIDIANYLDKVIKDFEYDYTKENNKITFNLTKPNMPLSDLYSHISDTIYNILQKGEIKDITFASYKFVKDTSKEQILNDIKETLGKTYTTLDQLEYFDKNFTITIGNSIDTVNLVNNNTYTFDFNANFVVVNQNGKGVTDIKEALEKEKYSTIYLEGEYTLDSTLEISKDITIEGLGSSKQTIKLTNAKDYVIKVTKTTENVTISNLKLTGASIAQLDIEKDASVIVKNIDVSGLSRPVADKKFEIHAGILVKGKLDASNTKIENADEHYTIPTIALVKGCAFYQNPEVEETAKEKYISDSASVSNVTIKNPVGKYYVIDMETSKLHQTTKGNYAGEFYYNDGNNSIFYHTIIMDNDDGNGTSIDYILTYYYGEQLNLLTKLGYQVGTTQSKDGKKVFNNFTISGNNTIVTDETLSQNVLKPNATTNIVANYITKTSINLNVNKPSSKIITTQTNGKFYLPVSITSEQFIEDKTTLEITNPNNITTKYTYNSNSQEKIVTISNNKTINLNLEAIKSSKITTGNGKVYTIKLDIDGEGSNYQAETYKVDYNDVKTLEEVINEAALNTENANSLTVLRDNKIKNNVEQFTYMYNKTSMRTYYKSTDNKIEQYSFPRKYIDSNHVGDGKIVLLKNSNYECDNTLCIPKLNDWIFSSFIQKTSMGVHEISLLKDVITTNQNLNAIDSVTEVNGKYEILINMDRFVNWLNDAYLDNNSSNSTNNKEQNHNIKLIVELTSDKKYVTSIKTSDNFTIIDNNNNKTTNNELNVTISNINKTDIKEPEKFLSVTKEELKEFDTKSQEYWEKHTGSEVAK